MTRAGRAVALTAGIAAAGFGLVAAPTLVRADGEAPAPAPAPVPAPAPQKSVKEWIDDLASPTFEVRERATAALSRLGKDALPELRKALTTKDPEVRWRLEQAIEAIEARPGAAPQGAAPKPGEPAVPRPAAPATPGVPDAMRQLQEELKRMDPALGELFPGLRGEMLPPELGRAFEELERTLRGFERMDPATPRGQAQPRVFRQFRTFRFKDGRWTIEESGDGLGAQSPADRIGLRTTDVPPIARAQLGLAEGGLGIDGVEDGSFAARAGFEPDDIILEADGLPVHAAEDLDILRIAGEHKLKLLRGGRAIDLTVVGEPPAEAPAAPKREGMRGF
jgi:hypothetical protein